MDEEPAGLEESAWTPVAITLTVVLCVLLLGFFFWWSPQQPLAARDAPATIATPARPAGLPSGGGSTPPPISRPSDDRGPALSQRISGG